MNKKILHVSSLCSIFICFLSFQNVFADDHGGNNSGGITVNCGSPTTAYQLLCGDPAGSAGGGASWHVYTTDTYSGPTFIPDYLPLNYGTISVEDIKVTCPSSKYTTYTAYGWDGLNDRLGQHIGPANYGSGVIGEAYYNNYNAVGDKNTLQSKLASGYKNIKITQALAEELHGGSFGNSTGYFCNPELLQTFKGKAQVTGYGSVNANTNWRNSSDSVGNREVSTEMECLNTGCEATFTLSLKTISGDGQTTYSAQKKVNNGSWTNVTVSPASPSKPSTSGTNILSTTVTLPPGQTVCYKLNFKSETTSGSSPTYVSACIYAKPSTFQGKTTVTGTNGGENTTDWQNTNTTKITTISNCSPISGCKTSFYHYMKRTAGIGSSDWTLTRTSNLTSKVSTTVSNSSGTFNPSSSTSDNNKSYLVTKNENLTLYPGMIVCETLSFQPTNASTSKVSTTVCVHALDDAQSSDNALLNIKVKNANVTKYNTYMGEVYAKPGDSLTYHTTYIPTLQYTYNLIPSKMQINGGTIYPTSGTNTSTLGTLFNSNHGSSLSNWNNAFSVQRTSKLNWSSASLIGNYAYTAGDTTTRTTSNTVAVATSHVGKSIDERAITNLNNTTKTTPSQVTFTEVSNNNTANVITSQISSIARAYIPYNFINTTAVTTDTSTPFYAGEQQKIDFTITTSPRCNSVTTNDTCTGSSTTHKYATKVDSAKWKLAVKIGNGDWQYTDPDTHSDTGTLNSSSTSTGATVTKNLSIIVPDVDAGTEICVKSMIYPANSGASTNWSNKEGSHTWAESSQKCFTVAKRPSIQVWGGNVYTNNGITTSTSIKQHLSGITSYALDARDSKNDNYVFGSWGDQGVMANGAVNGFASGAALGYNLGNKETSSSTSFCNRIPLTFANAATLTYSCLNPAGSLNSAKSDLTIDKSTLISKFIFGTASGGSKTITSFLSSANQTGNVAYRSATNITLSPNNSVPKNIIQVIHAKNVTITKDILYDSSSEYTNFSVMPKLLIYGEDSVNINCSVNRIDAIIVSTKVTTCSDGDGTTDTSAVISNAANYKQLIINGAVIANQLIANRAYGAATGANSIVAAEIINFDPSLYRWDLSSGNTSSSGVNANTDLTTTYQKELAPRY